MMDVQFLPGHAPQPPGSLPSWRNAYNQFNLRMNLATAGRY